MMRGIPQTKGAGFPAISRGFIAGILCYALLPEFPRVRVCGLLPGFRGRSPETSHLCWLGVNRTNQLTEAGIRGLLSQANLDPKPVEILDVDAEISSG